MFKSNSRRSWRLQTGLLAVCVMLASPAYAQCLGDEVTTEKEATSKTTMMAQQTLHTSLATNAVFDRLATMNAGVPSARSGFSSGNNYGVNVWANPYHTHAKDTNQSTGYESDTFGAFFGGDYALNKNYTVGLMFGLDGTDIDSRVNGGGSDTFGFTVAPYARFALDKTYSADMSVGFTTSNSDNDRVFSGSRITGSNNTNRFFGGVGLNGSYWQDRWNFLVRAGTTMSYDKRAAFTESDGTRVDRNSSTFAQAQLGATAGYYFENVRPWVSLTYTYDYARELPVVAAGQVAPTDDRDQVILGAGATVFGFGRVTGDLSIKNTFFKEKYSNTTVGLTLSTTF